MKSYATLKKENVTTEEMNDIRGLCDRLGVEGTEVFMDDICSRSNLLYNTPEEKGELIKQLQKMCVKRVHCSYWAYPTSFLTKNDFSQLTERFGGESAVREYYGDLTGKHMYERWVQEYIVAKELNAQSYTFHLIDYAPIDGMWEFTVSREDIRQAMIFMIQHLLNLLSDQGILTEDSPLIEVENAGFGLEYGLQTAEDFWYMYNQLYDPLNKVKIGWDVNHLLHALGINEENGKIHFMLQQTEMTEAMRGLESEYGMDKNQLPIQWIKYNLLHPAIAAKAGAIHLADCKMKRTEYFTNGKLNEPYYSEISSLKTWEEKEEYGVQIVLSKYDSHVILGEGALDPEDMSGVLKELKESAPDLVILHELKNCENMGSAVQSQMEKLCI